MSMPDFHLVAFAAGIRYSKSMTTIEQTIEIPADHRVLFEFLAPREIPAGPARLELKVTPVHGERGEAEEQTVKSDTPITDRLSGTAAHLGDITLEQIREERLRKYL
jgi:hypothetical protein